MGVFEEGYGRGRISRVVVVGERGEEVLVRRVGYIEWRLLEFYGALRF